MEISRRCLACGASVRVRAAFCPQCGRELGERSSSPNAEGVDELRTKVNFGATTQAPNVDENLPVTRELRELNDEGRRTVPNIPKKESPISSVLSPHTNFALESHVAPETNNDDGYSPIAAPVNTFAPTEALPPVAPRENSLSDGNSTTNKSANELNTSSHRIITSASGAPVGQAVSVRRRADKLRGRSEAFIEEASDDPGLRFVLIAVALFLLFLVFLFFSHIIG